MQTQNDRDRQMYTQIETELGEPSNDNNQQWLTRAIALKASVELLAQITWQMADPAVGLPWIHQLLAAGYAKDEVRQIVEKHCLDHEYFTSTFQRAFLADYAAWQVFDPPALAEFLTKLTEGDRYNGEQMLLQLDANYKDLLWQFGYERLYAIAEKAVLNLKRLKDGRVIMVIRKLSKRLQERAAERLYPDWNTIPFIVETLKGFSVNDLRLNWYAGKLIPEHWPLQTPTALRWALLGGKRYEKPWHKGEWVENDFVVSEHYKGLRRAMEDAGWMFARLEENPKHPGQLQAVCTRLKGMRLVYVHDNNGARSDRLKVGDEVMVPIYPNKALVNGRNIHALKPLEHVSHDGYTRIFQYELHPVAPPTPEMLAKPDYYFRGDDIVAPK